jgi:hypothetical protein
MQPIAGHGSVSRIGMKKPGGERCVDLVEEFEKQQTDAISVGQESIAAGVWQLFDQTFGTPLPQFIAESSEGEFLDRYCQSLRRSRLQFSGGEGVSCGDLGEPYQRTDYRQLPRMVQFEPRNALTIRL